uniref:F protein n=1 Tax=Antheraea pernyi nuclear polyhedrosis virus TaxID=161494 RepID=A8C6D5_NPVAP|nr:F protein [Antheraea pernyi nucleopolyhedrovirus]
MFELIICAALVGAGFADPLSFEPIDDASGLVFERLAALRHVSDERFVFIKTVDFDPLLQELSKIIEFLQDPHNDATACPLVKAVKPKKPRAIAARIAKHLSSLTQLDPNFVSYEFDNTDPKINEVITDVVQFDYVDSRQQDADFDEAHSHAHWSDVNAADARALLRGAAANRAALLPAVTTANVTEKYLDFVMCINGNRSSDNECLYLVEMHKMMAHKLADAVVFADALDRFVKQTRRNKLNATNGLFDDTALLQEMRQLVKALARQNLSWAVDFARPINKQFDLSQAYRLHLYANKNEMVLCVAMPLMRVPTPVFSLYRVATVPFCRGTMCLMMVPSTSHIAVTDTRNYYAPVPADFNTLCKQFTGYDEFLCPASPRIATADSGVCEIEMFMGRYVANIDSLCDVRVADNGKQLLLDPLVTDRKWLYSFARNVSVGYVCGDKLQEWETVVPPGVGLVVAQPLQTCSARVIDYPLFFNVDSTFYAMPSRSYWPRKRFNYNNYVDAALLNQTSTPFADAVTDLSLAQLKTLRSRFHIRDYTASPKLFFSPRRDVQAPEPVYDTNTGAVLIFVLIGGGGVLCLIAACCAAKRYCRRKRAGSVAVMFRNDERQPIITIANDMRGLHIAVPNNNAPPQYKKAMLFPMEIKQLNNKIAQ